MAAQKPAKRHLGYCRECGTKLYREGLEELGHCSWCKTPFNWLVAHSWCEYHMDSRKVGLYMIVVMFVATTVSGLFAAMASGVLQAVLVVVTIGLAKFALSLCLHSPR